MSKNFVFRVDSSKIIGSGHLMRCLTLAKGLRDIGAKCSFICRDLDRNLNKLPLFDGFEVAELPTVTVKASLTSDIKPVHSNFLEVDWETDATQSLYLLSKRQVDWLVVDHYALCENWELAVSACGAKIMVIDDLADRSHYCDLLLDQNLGNKANSYRNLLPKTCVTLFGPQYALLRPEFCEYREASIKYRETDKTRHILINFGGGDPNDLISKTLQNLLLIELPARVEISVIFGSLASMTAEHEQIMARYSNKVVAYGMVNNMAEILSTVDLVIGASGSSVWERCCLGIPSIIFAVAKNQDEIADNLSACGAALALNENDLKNGKFCEIINNCVLGGNTKEMSQNAAKICDGEGVKKLLSHFND